MNAENLCGTVLGTCTLQKLIGRGGMGAVFLAQQSRPNRQVAVKVLLPLTTLQPNQKTAFLERFRRETDAAASLEHPNIVPVHEYGERNGMAYLVMPYISGGTLRDELEKNGQLPLSQVAHYLDQLASALDCAHERGVIHRDIKPANILITPEKRLLLTDFGLVKIISDGKQKQNPLSEIGMPMGTPDYMAPEQVVGVEIDTRADIYALGVILYHMLTGTVPFKGTMPMKVAMQHVHTPPPPLRTLRPDLHPSTEQTVLRAIAKLPADRYLHASDLSSAFRLTLEAAGTPLETSSNIPVSTINASPLIANQRHGIFNPARQQNNHIPAATAQIQNNQHMATALNSSSTAQKTSGIARNDIVGKNSMNLPSFSGILTQANLPALQTSALPMTSFKGDKHTPLPLVNQSFDQQPAAPAATNHTPLPPTRLRLGHKTSLRGLQPDRSASTPTSEQLKPIPEQASLEAPLTKEQPGGNMNPRDQSSQSPKDAHDVGPKSIFGPARPAFPIPNIQPATPVAQAGEPARPFSPGQQLAGSTRRLEPAPPGSSGIFQNPGLQQGSTGIFQNPGLQPNSNATFPNQGQQPGPATNSPNQEQQISFNGSFPHQGQQPGSTGIFPNPNQGQQTSFNGSVPNPNQGQQTGFNGSFPNPNQGQQTGFNGSFPHQGQQPGSTGTFQNSGWQPGSTGMLPNPETQSGNTSALQLPTGEYNGETGMLKLAQPVRVVKVPIAGQPGQYMTGILPMLPEAAEPAPSPFKERMAALPGAAKQNPKRAFIIAAIIIILLSSVTFLLTRIPTGQQATTNGTATNAKNNLATTATARASATADANIIRIDPLSTNIHNWRTGTFDKHQYAFKDNAYHISTDDGNAAYATLPEEIPANLAFSASMYEVKGADDNRFNQFGLIVRFNEDQQNNTDHVTFYCFKVAHTTSAEKDAKQYNFFKFDNSKDSMVKNDGSPWTSIWNAGIGDEYHFGQGGANTNTFKVVANGDKFTFFVNGKQVGDKQDGAYTNGRIGLEVDASGTEVAFSNLRLTQN